MAKKIWRHTLTLQEQKFWNQEEMQGWRDSMVGCVEDEARENGCKKYMAYDRKGVVVAKGEVSVLELPEPIEMV